MSFWRKNIKDGTFVEGVKHEPTHVHYDPRGGSDIPVNWKNQETGQSINLRETPLRDLPQPDYAAEYQREQQRQRDEQERRDRDQQNTGW